MRGHWFPFHANQWFFFKLNELSEWPNLDESRAYEQQIREIGEQLAELQRARDQELGGRLKEVEAEAKEKDKETLKIDADIKVELANTFSGTRADWPIS